MNLRSEPEPAFGRLVTRASSRAQRAAQDYLDRFGIKLAYWPMLRALSDGKPHSQAELAAFADRTKAAISLILAEMEGDGLVARKVNPDSRREMLVTLTGRGRTAWQQTKAMAAHVNAIAWTGFSRNEIDMLCRLLQRAIANLDHDQETR